MKMRIDIEMTPEELRRFLGLPDLSSLNDEWLARLRDQASGADMTNVDAAKMLQPMLTNNAAAMEAFNRAFWSAFSGASVKTDPPEGDAEPTPAKGRGSSR